MTDLQKAIDKFDYVRFTYADLHGISRSKTVCKSAFAKAFKKGPTTSVGTFGMGLKGELGPSTDLYTSHPEKTPYPLGNVNAMAIPGTLHPLPYAGAGKYQIGEVLCETFYSYNGARHEECCRFIANKQIERLKAQGFELYCSFEIEFYLLDAAKKSQLYDEPVGFCTSAYFSKFEPVLLEIADILEEMGIEVETLQVEYGKGQFEVVLAPTMGITAADNVSMAKDCIKEVAVKHGYMAVFMTKPLEKSIASGLHLNHSLKRVSSSENAFSDVSRDDGLSKEFRFWMGGLIRHFPALITLSCPTVNCYRRLHVPWSPNWSDWGIEDRMASFRVKTESPSETYIESRLPSSCANPYIVIASTLAAGLDGLENEYAPPPPTQCASDVDKSLYSTAERTGAPRNMEEGLALLKNDDVLTKAFGDLFIQCFIALKGLELSYMPKIVDNGRAVEEQFQTERKLYMEML